MGESFGGESIGGQRWDEHERIAALRSFGILDTPPEPDFDDLVRLIAQICEAPRAAISLIDEHRQWFKAEVGLGVREIPLHSSICASIALKPGLTVIPDVRSDKRFNDNSLMGAAPWVRFYAGVLLETSEGVPLGTLCVLDDDVRELNPSQEFALVTLARQVMALLELRRALIQRDSALAARARAEEGQNLLTRELHHRVKNTLATVQALAGSTARTATNVDQFRTALSGRIGALAKTHATITEDGCQAASLSDLLRLELGPFAATRADRVTMEGPEVRLPSELAVPLGLALHELTSNAAKFGALSSRQGRVQVIWRLAEEGRKLVHLEWRESGGPAVPPLRREGFGSRVLGRVLTAQIGAEVHADYPPDGVRVSIRFPIAAPEPSTTAVH